MEENTGQVLFEDLKRLLDSAREDYEKKQWNNHSYYVVQFNLVLKRAKDLGVGSELSEIKEAEADEEIPTSWSSGAPYHPLMEQSVGSKTRKLREVIDTTDKLFREISSVVRIESEKIDKKTRAISQIQKLIDAIDTLKAGRRHSNDFNKWKRDVEVAIEQIFPQDSRHLKDFRSVGYYPLSAYGFGLGTEKPSEQELQTAYVEGLEKVTFTLRSMIEEIETYWNGDDVGKNSALQTVQLICSRFHTVARQLRQRHADRVTLDISDEYDVQDLLHSLLRIFFDDIREEDNTPIYAGGASRIDFVLKQEQVIVEVKKTRPTLKAKELGEQLIIDIARYRVHPDCKLLYCFVYDPDGYIKNPQGIENDLSRSDDPFPVKVFIAPKTH
jgi:hypothetical protein